jgi:hypothetical protein
MQATEYINGEVRVYQKNNVASLLIVGLYALLVAGVPIYLTLYPMQFPMTPYLWLIIPLMLPIAFAKFRRALSPHGRWCPLITSQRGIQVRDLLGNWKTYPWSDVFRIEVTNVYINKRYETVLQINLQRNGLAERLSYYGRRLIIREFVGSFEQVIQALKQIPQFTEKYVSSEQQTQDVIAARKKRSRWIYVGVAMYIALRFYIAWQKNHQY